MPDPMISMEIKSPNPNAVLFHDRFLLLNFFKDFGLLKPEFYISK